MRLIDEYVDDATNSFARNEGVAISTVAADLRNKLGKNIFSHGDLANMFTLLAAEKAHAVHQGDWA
jgi:hypothetical protein